MGLSDPFESTYRMAAGGRSAIGEGILNAIKFYVEEKAKKDAAKQELIATLATKGLFPAEGLPKEPSTVEDYAGIAKQYGKTLTADRPDTARRLMEAAGIPTGKRPAIFNLPGLGSFYQSNVASPEEKLKREKEERYLRTEEVRNINDFGGKVFADTIQEEGNRLKVDFDSAIEQYGIERKKDESGRSYYDIPSLTARREMITRGTFKSNEIDYLTDVVDTRDTLQEVKDGLADLGITRENIGKLGTMEKETVDSPLGPVSIPARFNLAAQYTKDPKYVAMKQKLERAFQKYRKIVTGAQASNKELRALRPLIASFADRPGVFFENMDTLINESERMFDNRLRGYEAAGRDIAKMQHLIDRRSSTRQSVSSGGWTDAKEARYQELLKKRGK